MNRWSSEWLLLRRDRAAWLLYAFFACACVVAVADSLSSYAREQQLQRELAAEERERIRALQHGIANPPPTPVAAWYDPSHPGPVGRGGGAAWVWLPLSELAVVRSQARPASAVSVSSEGGALDRAKGDLIEPRVASLGRFDLGFLLIVVLPLVVLMLTFDIIARDHESGVARLMLAQESRPRTRYVLRAALRAAPVVALTLTSVTIAVARSGGMSAASAPGLATLFALISLIATFWAAVALLIQTWLRTATASAILCLSAWTACVILLPTLLSLVSEAVVPIPSRIERTSASREALRKASIEAEGLVSRYLGDHPELSGAQVDVSDYYVRRVAIDAAVAAARAPVERAFFDSVDRRRELAAGMAIASPVSLVALALDELAGTSDARNHRFRSEVDAFQARFAAFFHDKTVRGEPLTLQTLQERPSFSFDDARVVWWPLIVLALWTVALCALAFRRLRHAVELDRTARKLRFAVVS